MDRHRSGGRSPARGASTWMLVAALAATPGSLPGQVVARHLVSATVPAVARARDASFAAGADSTYLWFRGTVVAESNTPFSLDLFLDPAVRNAAVELLRPDGSWSALRTGTWMLVETWPAGRHALHVEVRLRGAPGGNAAYADWISFRATPVDAPAPCVPSPGTACATGRR